MIFNKAGFLGTKHDTISNRLIFKYEVNIIPSGLNKYVV
jgi:hypothetical protein